MKHVAMKLEVVVSGTGVAALITTDLLARVDGKDVKL
jgi:hypothetical protein